jgi:hypothetical protein
LTRVGIVANGLARWLIPMKRQVQPNWEYSGVQDPTCEVNCHISIAKLEQPPKEMF